jgi:hypothetical protein
MAGKMKKSLILLLAATLVVASCGAWRGSRVNPKNWFGGSESTPVAQETPEEVNPLIPKKAGLNFFGSPDDDDEDTSVLASTITELRIEQTPVGAIIRATALTERQGAYEARLRLEEDPELAEKGVLAFTFRVLYPATSTPVGSERTRLVQAAASVTHQDLAAIRTIRVTGATNQRESRRR